MQVPQLIILLLTTLVCSIVQASHFRYGTISYRVANSALSSTKVEMTVVAAWRTSFIGTVRLFFGTGVSEQIPSTAWDFLGNITDASNESYTITSKTLLYDYGLTGNFTAYFQSCCRIHALENDPSGQYRVEASVKLDVDKNGPRASFPPIIQMKAGAQNSILLSSFLSDIDNDAMICLFHPEVGKGGFSPVPTTPSLTSMQISPNCRLVWDLTGYEPKYTPKFSVSMLARNSLDVSISIDFIVEVIDNDESPLTCDPVGIVTFTARSGDVVHADFLVEGGPPGSIVGDVTTVVAGPGGATLSSKFNATNILPKVFHFHLIIPTGSSGTLQYVLQFQLGSQFCSQGVSVNICDDDDGDGVCNEADVCAGGNDRIDTNQDGVPDFCEDGGGQVYGDPHISRWNQKSFDFHGECDLLMVHSNHVNGNKVLDLHIRTKIVAFYSSIQSAALRVGQDVLEANATTFWINGLELDEADLPYESSEFIVSKPIFTPGYKVRRDYNVTLNDKSTIRIRKTKSFLSISVFGNHRDFGRSYGLLGNFFTGEALGRDGRTIEDWNEYGMEWQILDSEPKLFREDRGPQLPQSKCTLPSLVKITSRRLRSKENGFYKKAELACAHVTIDEVQSCIDDIVNTGDLESAEVY